MKRFIFTIAVLVIVAGFSAASGNGDALRDSDTGIVADPLIVPEHLVDVEWLVDNLDAENLVVLDTARQPEEFESGHIPGALYADREAYWAEVNGIPGMFPGVDSVTEWLEELGISNHSSVVIYDSGAGLWAARVAWTLSYLGHDNWAVLDGGYGVWEADGHPTDTGPSTTAISGNFSPELRDHLLIDGKDIVDRLDDPDFVVVDTRSTGEYNGSDVRAAKGGHIPGALSLEWTLNNSSGSLPTFLAPDELAEFYVTEGVTDDKSVVTLCQTGVRGAHTWLALTLAGYDDVALYDGGWVDWAGNDAYPVEN